MMRKFLLVLCALAVLSVEAKKKKTSVITSLTPENFQSTLEENDGVMVKFFAPWCGHCKALAPEYEKAAPQLKEFGVLAAEVDCTEAGDLCTQHDIKGYPSVKLFQKGKAVIEYEGERKADPIVAWVKRMKMPALTVVPSQEEMKTFIESNTVVAAATFPADAAEHKLLESVCDQMRQSVSCVALIGEPLSLAISRNEDGEREAYSGEWTEEALKSWINVAIVPLVAEISPANARTFVEASVPVGFLYVDIKSADFQTSLKPAMVALARANRGAMLFTIVDTNKYARMAKSVGLSGTKFPAFVIENPQKSHFVYPEADTITEEALLQFTTKVLAGEIPATIRSQPVPATQGPVYTLVGDTFKQIVFDEKRDVMVKFFAPWCGHCKSMAPEYEALAKSLEAQSDKVLIAEMDATENDSPPPIHITGFPTVMFFPAGNKEHPVTYQGARTKDAMAEFIYEHSTLVAAPQEEKEEAAPAPVTPPKEPAQPQEEKADL